MPNEPDKPIDKLLKAYAQKRRQDAGAPFEMHPATRNLLQSEAARTFPRKAASGPQRAFSGFWLRFAMGGAVLMVLAAVIFVQTDNNPTPPIDMTRHRESERFSSTRAQTPFSEVIGDDSAPAPTTGLPNRADRLNEPGSSLDSKNTLSRNDQDKELQTESADRFGLRTKSSVNEQLADAKTPVASIGQSIPSPAGPAVTSRPEEPKASETTPPIISDATPQLAKATDQETRLSQPATISSSALEQRITQATSDTRSAGGTISTGEAYFKSLPAQPDDSSSRQFHFSQADETSRLRRYSSTPIQQGVLTSFQVQQNGDNLNIVDADGSVYRGTITRSDQEALGRGIRTESAAQLSGVARGQAQNQAPNLRRAISNSDSLLAGENLSFRAIGTNRSLQQQVIFTGNVLPATRMQTNPGGLAGRAHSPAQAPASNTGTSLESLQWGRIEGKASVGTNEIRIRAVRTAP